MNHPLPELAADQQRLFALTAGVGRQWPVRFGNDIWHIHCAAPRQSRAPELSIPLLIGKAPACLDLTLVPGGRLFERHAEFLDLSGVSEAFANAIRAALNRELLDALQSTFETCIDLSPPHPTPPPLQMAFDLMDASGTREASGLLHISDETLALIEKVVLNWPSKPNPALQAIRQPVAFGVSFFDMSLEEISQIQPGDCLILGEAAAWPFPLWISAGSAPTPLGFPPRSPVLPLLDAESQPATMTPKDPTSLQNLKIPVLIVAARKDMTLEEITALREGSTIEIGSDTNIPVEIEINHQILAQGHLVRVADQVCARVTSVRDAGSP